jgi:hypothetical protein
VNCIADARMLVAVEVPAMSHSRQISATAFSLTPYHSVALMTLSREVWQDSRLTFPA